VTLEYVKLAPTLVWPYHGALPMRPLNRTRMAKKYRGKWLALKADRKTVVGAGGTIREARAAAAKKGHKNPVITRMPRTIQSFVGFHLSA
jgi:NADPH-dependent 2,4-dienoyl-CoA reductase/sulfur reductase-like enzyme